MPLPSSGPIAFSDLNAETGSPPGYSSSMQWINENAKTSVGGGAGSITALDQIYGLAYYQSNNYGNCNNGNEVNCNCNCGNINCNNCVNCNAINCANCDSQAWLQPNCNCNCTYNCDVNSVSYNCNCACPWICACW
jgi:hypothetical protein